uniref:Lipoprotein n=1 Tax=Dechloromonas aromatica (strain RCB) TaxID=159087 RepID=Q477S4_DECAR
MHRIVVPALLTAVLLAGCSTFEEGEGEGPALPPDMARRADGKTATAWPTSLGEAEVRKRITRLMPASAKDKAGWAEDLHTAFKTLEVPHATQTYCAAMAIIEQESSFQADPVVPGLPNIVRRELETRAGRYGVPSLIVTAALSKNSPSGKSYNDRIDALKTETQLNDLFEDMIGELPFGRQLFADYNPVRTGGPMQVSVEFASQHVKERSYPYPIAKKLRNEVFTRRGGVYFGSAILLDYEVPYDAIVYRFADFNAGRYSSRNAAFQLALGKVSGKALTPDGDLLRYENGQPAAVPSSVEEAAIGLAAKLDMSRPQIRRDLLLEKTAAFSRSPLFNRLFELAEKQGKPMPRQAIPQIDLKSPKITRKLTTEWFARRVEGRYKACLARGVW